ncbi:MAG: glycosyltransferase [Candidatus Berkelbacteria bacterium]
MKVVVASELHFFQAPDGTIWSAGAFNGGYWKRYTNVFSGVIIIARVKRLSEVPKNFVRVDSKKISFINLPDFLGPFDFLIKYYKIKNILIRNLPKDCAYCLQAPGTLSNLVTSLLADFPYGLNVISDPGDAFSPGTNKNIFRWYFRRYYTQHLKKQCLGSSVSSYVTLSALQQKYPPGKDTYAIGVSDAILKTANIRKNPKKYFGRQNNKILYVGTLSQLYKSPEVLIRAIKICKDYQRNYRLTIIGDGKYRKLLERMTEKLGLSKKIKFLGQINDFKQIFKRLDQSDLFVLPSRAEGMPRALIEAMAAGLPAISTSVGGIPEILPKKVLVPPNDPEALAKKIIELLSSPEMLEKNSGLNLQMARKFDSKLLQKKTDRVLRKLKQKTEEYLRKTNSYY